ncbi:hypothetical protein [Stutzerimonas nitrititolerans]|uniref:hypothetical protein n=1 Tax=Stutzerimonas nitrititolerans TaxID=2482751 RepID=UPI0028ACC2D5|nr:hypothetical protein [Stutzerimonas nitrititolerans]
MKADWNDAPDYVRSYRRKKSAVAWVIPGVIGTVIVLAGLQVAGSAFLKSTTQSIVEKRTQPKPAPIAEITRAEPATRDWDKVVEEVAARGATPQPQTSQPQAATAESPPKQTAFNDKNYVPQGAINIVPATRVTSAPTVTGSPRQKEIVVVGKERRISDFCPGGEGSIARRNCKSSVNLNLRN